jgi:hypothetical protein
MIILRVAMGHGLLKDTVKEISTGLVFAERPTSHEQSPGICMTVYKSEVPISLPGTTSDSSHSTVKKHTSTADVVSLV